MKLTKSIDKCQRVLLSRNEAGRVGYCENCDVVELEIGAISLRIEAKDLSYLASLFKDADARLAYYLLEKEHLRSNLELNVANIH